jgi:TldD protein
MIHPKVIEDIINAALTTGADFAEVFIEDKHITVMDLIGGRIERANGGHDFGVGIRIFMGTNSVYAYTNHTDKDNLVKLAKDAAVSIKGTDKNTGLHLVKSDVNPLHRIIRYPVDVARTEKVKLLKSAYRGAKEYSPLISQVTGYYLDEDQRVCIANSEGLYKEDRRVRTRCGVSAVASSENDMQTGSANTGAHRGFELYDEADMAAYGIEAARIATTMLRADYAPSGKMPVVIDNGFGGVIFHEACGHGLEATSVAKGTSVYTGKMGEKIASSLVTAIDDGTALNQWGSASIDDEGHVTQKNILIEKGILKSYLVDKMGGRKMRMEANGCSRRQSYKYEPTSRMSNTYIAPGQSRPEEIIAQTASGFYARSMGGGSVNPATGEFNFAVQEGYMIRNGKIAEPLRGATLIGTGLEVLQNIDRVGTNLKMGQGMCGSISGSIPANVGQPMVRVSSLIVGGRKAGA